MTRGRALRLLVDAALPRWARAHLRARRFSQLRSERRLIEAIEENGLVVAAAVARFEAISAAAVSLVGEALAERVADRADVERFVRSIEGSR